MIVVWIYISILVGCWGTSQLLLSGCDNGWAWCILDVAIVVVVLVELGLCAFLRLNVGYKSIPQSSFKSMFVMGDEEYTNLRFLLLLVLC
jgi:hypothetical protein